MKKTTTREKLINSAHKLFYEKGYNATSIDDILKDAGLNKGSLYHLFKSKKELLLAVINERIAYNFAKKYKDIATVKNPLKFLKQKLLSTDDFDFKHGCMLNNLIQEMSPVDSDIAKALLRVYNDLEYYYFLSLRNKDMDDKEKQSLAKMILATVEGAITAAKAAQDKAPYIEIVEQLFEFLEKYRQHS